MLDYLGILQRLNERGVEYIVVGGVAVNMHGIPRMTYDLDLLVALEDGNLGRLLGLLQEWGFKPRAPVQMMDLAVADKREAWIHDKGMMAFTVVNPEWALSEIDLLIDSPVSFEHARVNRAIVRLGEVAVPLISIQDLIRMKQGTGRAQDEADLRYLRRIAEEQQQ